MGKLLCSVDGEHFEELGHVSDIELSAEEEEIAERFFAPDTIELTAQAPELNMDGLVRNMLGQSAYNSMKLREDGYLSPENGWFTPIESPVIELIEKIDKERRRHDKERERSTKSGIEE
ncbi:MAG: hypothetical protein IKS59_06615 [Aeriscardovia sp.]|nr:hypothetical protein [Aeriscardovia sp.]